MIPPRLARGILNALTLGLSELRRRDELGKLSDDALDALQALYTVAVNPPTSASGSEPAAAPTLETAPPGGGLLTAAEAALLIGSTSRHIRRICQQGHLPASRLGRDWAIRSEDLDTYRYGRGGHAA